MIYSIYYNLAAPVVALLVGTVLQYVLRKCHCNCCVHSCMYVCICNNDIDNSNNDNKCLSLALDWKLRSSGLILHSDLNISFIIIILCLS